MQFSNLPFKASSLLVEGVVQKLVTEPGEYSINLIDSTYSFVNGGFRPYVLNLSLNEAGEYEIKRISECTKNEREYWVASNVFDFERNQYLFEFIGEISGDQIDKGELADVYNLFTENIAAYYADNDYDIVKVDRIY